MKNILIFSHEFPPDVGGAGAVAEQNASILSQMGYSVTVLTREREVSKYSTEYKIITVNSFSKLWFLAYRTIIDFSNFDLILLNDPASIYVAGMFFDKKTLSKSLVFLHGSEPETIFLHPKLTFKLTYFKHFYTKALQNCKYIVAVSRYMKDKFVEKTKLSKFSERIIVNYAGVDMKLFYREKNEEFKSKYNIDSNKQVLLSVSRIVKEKGYFEMVEIFKKLVAVYEHYVWIIVGDGQDIDKLKKYVKDLKLDKFVIFEGNRSREKLRFYYSNADLFWLLSDFDESFGLVYLEAQACGCPVIGRNYAGLKEAVSNNKSGYLVDSKNEVLDILISKKYLTLKCDDVKGYARRFNLEEQIKSLLEVL